MAIARIRKYLLKKKKELVKLRPGELYYGTLKSIKVRNKKLKETIQR